MPASLALAELCLQTPGKGLISQAQPVLLRAGIQTSQLLSFSQGGSSAPSGHLLNPISQSIQQATKPGTKASTHSCPKKPLGDAQATWWQAPTSFSWPFRGQMLLIPQINFSLWEQQA